MRGAWRHQARSVVQQALWGLRQGAVAHSLSVGISALSLTALGAVGVVVAEIAQFTGSWGQDLTVTAFLKLDASAAAVARLGEMLRAHPQVAAVHHITQEQARERLARALGDRWELLRGLEDRVIPSAVEVEMHRGAPASASEQLAAALRREPVVEEVDYGAEELQRLAAAVNVLRVAAVLLGALIALVAVLVISSTLKLTVFARREEIEILKLVGASDVFVRAPFLLEGAAQGWLGATLAGGALLGLHQLWSIQVAAALSDAFGPISLGGPPWTAVAVLMVMGVVLGLVGGLVGVSRFLRV